MDKKKNLILIVLVFALLLVGASALYNKLSADLVPEQLAVAETAPPETVPPETTPQETVSTETAPQETVPSEPAATEPSRVAAPDFTVYDGEGNPVKLSDYFGKPIVLNFWASWCGPCKMEMPGFQEKSIALEGEVQFLMVNMTDGGRETVETAAAFIEEQGYTFPVFFDSSYDAAYTYGAYSLPTTYFIDSEGYAIAVANGAINSETLQRGIDLIYQP